MESKPVPGDIAAPGTTPWCTYEQVQLTITMGAYCKMSHDHLPFAVKFDFISVQRKKILWRKRFKVLKGGISLTFHPAIGRCR